jgi:hypothetical protein
MMEQESQQTVKAPAPAQAGREGPGPAGAATAAAEQRARLAVTRNVGLAAIVALGCVLLVLIVFNRPLVYRIFPWSEPGLEQVWPTAPASVKPNGTGRPDMVSLEPEEGVYWAETVDGRQIEVVDPTLRPDLYVTIEFTYACGCPGSFVPAYEGPYERQYPERAKAQREQMICRKCQQALKYLEDKEKAEEVDGEDTGSGD